MADVSVASRTMLGSTGKGFKTQVCLICEASEEFDEAIILTLMNQMIRLLDCRWCHYF